MHRASGQRDAIHDMPVFGAQVTFGRPTSSVEESMKTPLFSHGGRVTNVRGQLDFTDQPQVHLEPPGQ